LAEDNRLESKLYSAIDANINRSLEGIRVCEDIFRFIMHNSILSLRLKGIRHDIVNALKLFSFEILLNSRDIEKDSQKFIDLKSEKTRNSIPDLAKSNLHRAMEAMRSLEEFSKLLKHASVIDENPFQKIRFELYSLEKEIMQVLLKEDKHRHFENSLYAILDSAFIKNNEYAASVMRLINGGASIIQLRMKNHSMRDILSAALEVSALCKKNNVLFIVNDYPEIAQLSDADGVHLGQDDLPVQEVRKLLPANMLIGLSTHSTEQAIAAAEFEPDYIAIGPIYDTNTKGSQLMKCIGEEPVKEIINKTNCPVVCIGGIDPVKAKSLKGIGCTCFAVVSYLYRNDSIEENCRKFLNII
jgi:thiamine-phosphate pyrophosphorylase